MNYQFNKFVGVNSKVEDRITVTKSYTIGFPSRFTTDNKISDFKYVVLYLDPGQMAVGIQFTNDDNEASKFTVQHSDAGYGSSIVARSFFRVNGIDPKKYRGRYLWEKHNQDGISLYVINLKERPVEPEPTAVDRSGESG